MSTTFALTVVALVYGTITSVLTIYFLGYDLGRTNDDAWKSLQAALVLGLSWPLLLVWWLVNDP